jgi:TusA-related sulfurtransferase
MSSNAELDLSGIIWPMCLLEFKRALLELKSSGRIEVLVRDPEVADQLRMIIEHSEHRLIKRQEEGEKVRLFIQINDS